MREARHILSEALNERLAHNPGYSLRAFARSLEISPQLLSNVINGKRGLSATLAEKIANKIHLSEYEKTLFMESLKATFSRSKAQRIVARAKLRSMRSTGHAKNLELDLFKIISNWHHLALLELIKVADTKKNNPSWFAKKLGISENEVVMALGRLERLELVSKLVAGWKVNQDIVIADKGISSESVRNFHRQILEKATQALSTQTSHERYGSSSVIPIRVKNVEVAKKLIQEFRIKFDNEISDSENGEEIYGLSFQFFRLSLKEEKSV